MNQPYKILLLDTGKEWGGGVNSLLELLKRIDRQRFHIVCLFYYNYEYGATENIESVLTQLGIKVSFLPQRAQPIWATILKEALRACCFFSHIARQYVTQQVDNMWRIRPNAQVISYLLQQGYDCLYMNNQPLSNKEGYLAAKKVGVPILQHCRIEPAMPKHMVKLVNQSRGRIIGVSHGVVNHLIQAGVQADKCVVVCNGIDTMQSLPDTARIRGHYQLQTQAIVFGAVGSLIARKGIHFLLAAAAKLDRSIAWHILLVGEGPQHAALVQQAADLGIAERVIFAGFQTHPLPYIAAMDVCLLCSSQEGLPRVLLEAMVLEKPVIASDVIGSREVVRPEKTGLLVPYGNIDALTEAMRMLFSAEKRQVLGRAGRQVVEAEYTINQYVTGVETILEEVCSPSR